MNDRHDAPGEGGRAVLLRGGTVHSPADPRATALLVQGDTVAWVGSEAGADSILDGARGAAVEVVRLDGALVTPAFTDAHVHATATGLALTGLDLSGAGTLGEALARVRAHAVARPGDPVLLGQGWDASRWPERRPPTRAELDAAAGGRPLYLSRVDVHSAAVTTALLDRVPDVTALTGYHPDRPLTGAAHHAVRAAALAGVGARQRDQAQAAALARAAALGIGTVHECGGPDISSEDDFTGLLRLAAERPGPRVVGYWAEHVTGAAGADKVRALGAAGAAGDLFADGSLGSHTACLHQPYADTGGTGAAYLDAAAVAAHVAACTEAGLQAGFHAIGDAAVTAVADGVRAVADALGRARVRAARHRVEHAEMLTPRTVAAFADLGLTASVQPAFDAAWGGPDGMYAERLGPGRARTLNPYAALLRAGVPLALGSDSPVTPLDPWGGVRAAAYHRTPEHRIPVRAAFTAHTRGGWRAARRDGGGLLVPGAPADYAVWAAGWDHGREGDGPEAAAPGAAWSTDARPAAPALPPLAPGGQLPVCVRTVVAGRTVHERPNE
ncbi:amidohydrolase family protein [Streptomyces sp. B1866]|uniref:amidohydrolase n=1 Tax=Streptomyces sp. B1866 TaxID=3075431 RepID=UPI00288CB28F|nr:amidohydrolase family protein [Streptomyces sp. B1866]MDT3397638.1 amidohydrolase family protein [Streptomyces sp. B1866]